LVVNVVLKCIDRDISVDVHIFGCSLHHEAFIHAFMTPQWKISTTASSTLQPEPYKRK